jgi:HEAT repeat protein
MDSRDRESILEDLESMDEEVRRLAVDRLTLLPSEEAIPALVERLGDSSWRVRKAAIDRLAASARPAASWLPWAMARTPTAVTRRSRP